MSDPPAIELRDVRVVYRMGQTEIQALGGVSLAIDRGEFVSVVGPSGSGKSTLLSVMGCLMRPTSGRVIIDGEDVTDLPESRLAVVRARKIGFIFQFFNLISTLTALENVMLPMIFAGETDEVEMRHRALELLDLVGLADRADHRPAELSGGQQQRVAIARALANDPAIILADEPTGNLDSKTSAEVMDLVEDLNERLGKTFVIVTHDPKVAERARRRIYMLDGMVYDSPPNRLSTARSSGSGVDLRAILAELEETRLALESVSPDDPISDLREKVITLRMRLSRIRRRLHS